jgi:hypothetical protein
MKALNRSVERSASSHSEAWPSYLTLGSLAMQSLLLVASCWVFWLIYVVATVKTDLRAGITLWPLVKLALAAVAAGYVSSVLLRSPTELAEQTEDSPWRPMPLLIRVVLAIAIFTGGLGMIAVSLASSLFGVIGVAVGIACLPIALYFLFAGKYNPHDVP